MIIWEQKRRIALAFIAAFVLVLQSLGSAWAGREALLVDAFGNPLCVNDDVQGGSPHSNGHFNFSDCCAMVCSGWTGVALTPRDETVPRGLYRKISEQLGINPAWNLVQSVGNKQAHPRAPPIWI